LGQVFTKLQLLPVPFTLAPKAFIDSPSYCDICWREVEDCDREIFDLEELFLRVRGETLPECDLSEVSLLSQKVSCWYLHSGCVKELQPVLGFTMSVFSVQEIKLERLAASVEITSTISCRSESSKC